MTIADEKLKLVLDAHDGKICDELQEELIALANSFDAEKHYSSALMVHQKLDELFPQDFANKIVIVNYMYKYRILENAFHLMPGMARGYNLVLKELSTSTIDDDFTKHKLSFEIMSNMSRMVLKDIIDNQNLYIEAFENRDWQTVEFLNDINIAEIKASYSVGATIVDLYPDNKELKDYVYANWQCLYELFTCLCNSGKALDVGDKWLTIENSAILDSTAKKLNGFTSKEVESYLSKLFVGLWNKVSGPALTKEKEAWHKEFTEQSRSDYADLFRLRPAFSQWCNILAKMISKLGMFKRNHIPAYSTKNYKHKTVRKVNRGEIKDPRLEYATDWDLLHSTLYYWYPQNAYCKHKQKNDNQKEIKNEPAAMAKATSTITTVSVYNMNKQNEALHKFVSVVFPSSSKYYDYLAGNFDVEVGDYVNVMTPYGMKTGKVVNIFWSDGIDLTLPFYRYKIISEIAKSVPTQDDILYSRPSSYYVTEKTEAQKDSLSYANTDSISSDNIDEYDLIFSHKYSWHPKNIYHDDDEAEDIDHNRMVDDRGYMVNGKWLAEHKRNLSNPGSQYDSRGYVKSPAYEDALKDNFYLEEEEGYHGYDDPSSYGEDEK